MLEGDKRYQIDFTPPPPPPLPLLSPRGGVRFFLFPCVGPFPFYGYRSESIISAL